MNNKRIIDHYSRDDISDYSESNLIVYGFEHLRKQLEEADRREYAQKLASEHPNKYWYSISTEFEEDLNKGVIPQELQDKFKFATVTKGEGNEWQIDDERRHISSGKKMVN